MVSYYQVDLKRKKWNKSIHTYSCALRGITVAVIASEGLQLMRPPGIKMSETCWFVKSCYRAPSKVK